MLSKRIMTFFTLFFIFVVVIALIHYFFFAARSSPSLSGLATKMPPILSISPLAIVVVAAFCAAACFYLASRVGKNIPRRRFIPLNLAR